MAITIALALVLSLVFVIAAPVSAFTPAAWNVSGTWQINVIYNSVTYPETLSLTQSGSAITGVYIDTIPPGSYFTITTGSISGNHVIIDGVQGGLTVELVGDIANDGSMGGTWSDIVGGSRTGTWQSTSGHATQIANTADAQITGYVTAPTVSVTPPSGLNFVQFTFGTPTTLSSATAGSVAVTLGSATNVLWSVTALDTAYGNGYMWTGAYVTGTHLTDPLSIGPDGTNWDYANGTGSGGTLTYTGTNASSFNLYAQQTAVPADAAGTYSDVIVFSVSITSFN